TVLLIEHLQPNNIRGQQVRRELDSLERAVKAPRDRLGQCSFAYARDILDQQVPAGQQRDQGELDYFWFASYDAFYCRLELFQLTGRRYHRATPLPPLFQRNI